MNIVPYPTENSTALAPGATPGAEVLPAGVAIDETARRRRSGTWLLSVTTICFLFGALLAVQLRTFQTVRRDREGNSRGLTEAQARNAQLLSEFNDQKRKTDDLKIKLSHMQATLAAGLSGSQAKVLTDKIKELQQAAGLTPITGPGVVVVLNDNPQASKQGAADTTFLPGIVHDFDLLQVVNELRAAKADAIAINGTRITGYSPIRCVGPVIYINWEPVAPPFRVEAVGNPDTLEAALKLPNGILENLKNQTLVVRVGTSDKLKLKATESVPRLRVAKAQ